MSTKQILLGFLPWIAFSLIATRVEPGAVGMAALIALVVAIGLTVVSISRNQSPKLLELTGLGVFAVVSAVAVIEPASDAVLAFYGRGLAALALAAHDGGAAARLGDHEVGRRPGPLQRATPARKPTCGPC